MRLILAILVLLLFAVACKKDKFTTKPQMKIKETSSEEVFGNEILKFTIEITDKEGDFTPYFGYKKTTTSCSNSNFTDSTRLQIPAGFIEKKETQGEIELQMDPTIRGFNQCPGPGNTFKTDTAVFKFWIRDAAGNVSDTAVSKTIIIHP